MELIRITEREGKQVVSARDLYDFLGCKKQFVDWIRNRIDKYGLIQDVDYQVFSLIGEKGRPSIEYALTIDAAKELAMVEGNEKGKKARLYFIECEKALKAKPMSQIELIIHSANLILEQSKRVDVIEQEVREVKAQIQTTPNDYFTIAGFASLEGQPVDVKIAADLGRKATALCNQLGYIMGTMPDPRFGRVKTYPKEVLKTVFDDYFKLKVA